MTHNVTISNLCAKNDFLKSLHYKIMPRSNSGMYRYWYTEGQKDMVITESNKHYQTLFTGINVRSLISQEMHLTN